MASVILPDKRNRAGVWTFGILFLLESLTRSFNSGVLSIQAYDILHSTQKISVLGTVVSATVLVTTLLLPFLFRRMRRRWTYTMGCTLMLLGSLALATFTLEGQIAGTMLRNIGASITNVTLQLYILDNIKKTELTTSEPFRLAISTLAWVVGPFAGVWLYQHGGPWAPQIAAIASATVLLSTFWYMRLHDPVTMPSGNLQPFNPLANVMHFVRQPRLRLAWSIAFARSCFWAGFFTYGPLLMIEGGLGKSAGGLIISLSQFFLLFAFFYGPAARKLGVRIVIAACFAAMAMASLLTGFFGTTFPYLAAAMLLLGALAASGIDSIGGIPYLRSVRFHERQRMTAVYRTFLDFSDLLPSIVYAVALKYYDVSIVFIILGGSVSLMSVLVWRYLPKSM
ncbi:MFS transporter [Aestuariivirga litoralis]|uniref:MFS transporter n=1 Tax=Aestuariivirga litoralis TaxID=2650924 RepID=UPI0018C79F63|nr:MFS transporter [Aestuariivirga litoralis]